MTPARWQIARDLFDAAVQRAPQERDDWLRRHAADPALIHTVGAMLAADAAPPREPPPPLYLLELSLPPAWPDGARVGAFRIERRLGAGGMGEVYLAHRDDGQVAQRVALKRLRAGAAGPELRRRFLAERRILARLEHPNIARFLDAGSDAEQQPFVVMEYIEGVPITRHAGTHALGVAQILRLFLPVLDAVRHAHAQLIVHRDIKPGNVLVDQAGVPHLLDFGIAKVLDEARDGNGAGNDTEFGMRCFSLRHAAPEQLLHQRVDTACDIHALGALLYELLSGHAPLALEGLDHDAVERAILHEVPRLPSLVTDDPLRARALRGDLDRIVLHALEKSPRDRYPSVEAFAADLRCVLEHRPISLRLPHRIYRLLRFARRQRVPLLLGGAALVFLLAGGAAATLQWQRAERESALAQQERDEAEALGALLLGAFDSADPGRMRGEQLSASDVMNLAERRLSADPGLDPSLAAALLRRLSDVRLALDQPEAAQDAAQRAQRIADASGDAIARLHSQLALARVAIAMQRVDAAALAIERSRHAMLAAPARVDADDRYHLGALQVALHVARGEQRAALDLAEQLRQQAGHELGVSHRRTLALAAIQIERLAALRRWQEAVTQGETLLARAAAPELDADARRALGALARSYSELDRHAEATMLRERLLQGAERLYGNAHPAYARELAASAVAAAAAGDRTLADERHRQSIALLKQMSGPAARPALAAALNNHAAFLLDGGDAPEPALQQARQALEIAHQLQPAHPSTPFLQLGLGRALQANGRHRDAVQTLTEVDAALAARSGPERVDLPRLMAQARVAWSHLQLGDLAAARRWHDRARGIRDALADGSDIDAETERRLADLAHAMALPAPDSDSDSEPASASAPRNGDLR